MAVAEGGLLAELGKPGIGKKATVHNKMFSDTTYPLLFGWSPD